MFQRLFDKLHGVERTYKVGSLSLFPDGRAQFILDSDQAGPVPSIYARIRVQDRGLDVVFLVLHIEDFIPSQRVYKIHGVMAR